MISGYWKVGCWVPVDPVSLSDVIVVPGVPVVPLLVVLVPVPVVPEVGAVLVVLAGLAVVCSLRVV